MSLFDDDEDGYWAARFGMSPDDWQVAKAQAADQARQDYAAQTQAMASDPGADTSLEDGGSDDGGGLDKFQVAYQRQMQQLMAQRAAAGQAAQQPPAPPQMGVSDNGLSLMQKYEQYRPKTYVDGDTGHTIGWGHKLQPGESFPNGIDIESANKLFRHDVADAERAVRHYVKAPVNQNQYDALVSLAYNMGGRHFGSTDVVKSLNSGDYIAAGTHFGELVHARRRNGSHGIDKGLAPRRTDEMNLFNRPPTP